MNAGSGEGSDLTILRPPALRGTAYSLRPVSRADYDPLYAMLVTGDNAWRWRFRGSIPGPDEFVASLWAKSLASFTVADRQDRPVGYAQVYAHDFRSGTAYVGFALDVEHRQRPHVLETAVLLFDYTFLTWNLRKLYLEVPGWNIGQVRGGLGRYFVEEGRLSAHEFIGGRYWDMFIVAVYRETWRERPWANAARLRTLLAETSRRTEEEGASRRAS